jgi:DHA1 family tetracycline resistance protein-like MFS transporter
LQGAIASVRSLTSVVAPLLMTNLFSYFTSPGAPVYFPGAAFMTAALCCVGAMLVFVVAGGRPQSEVAEPAQ